MEDEFKLIKGKKKIRRKINNYKELPITGACVDENFFLRRLQSIRIEFKQSDYFIRCLATIENATKNYLNKYKKFICFGIGSFTTCISALHQLAFCLEICQHYRISHMEFFDPIFNDSEKYLLTALNCHLMSYNCGGKYPIGEDDCDLIFMPHCPKQLMNNLLWQNWNLKLLMNSIWICNSFEQLLINTPESVIEKEAQYVKKIKDFVIEFPLENCYKFNDIFNDISVHIFVNNEKAENESVWLKENEPVYCDITLDSLNIDK